MSHLVEIRGLHKSYPIRRGAWQSSAGELRALDGIDLSIVEGECLAIVGESGSGKSTLARCVMSLIEATKGEVLFAGEDLSSLPGAGLRLRRRQFQMIFQDPSTSLNPRLTIGELIAEPLEVFGLRRPGPDRQHRVRELLGLVGVPAILESSYPHELSGGQRQRVSIARALASEPRLLVADEPVASLDVSLRGQILNLLRDLQAHLGLTILLIAHDLALVEQVSDRVAVMYAGRIVELAPTAWFFRQPLHPYSKLLLEAARGFAPRIRGSELKGDPPDLSNLPEGCRFSPRCPLADDRCAKIEPSLLEVVQDREASCHYPDEMDAAGKRDPEHGTF